MTFERHSDKEVYNIFKSNLCLLHMMSHIRMNEVAYLSSTHHHANTLDTLANVALLPC